MNQMQGEVQNSWQGLRGVVGAWVLASPAREVLDRIGGKVRERVTRELALRGPETVVDAGAGSGFYSVELAARLSSGRVVAVDGSRQMLDHLRRAARRRGVEDRIDARIGDVSALPVGDGEADAAMSSNVLHELADPERAVRELVRVLKPGGRLVVTDFADVPVVGTFIRRRHDHGAHGPFGREDMRVLLQRAGLTDVAVDRRRAWLFATARKPD